MPDDPIDEIDRLHAEYGRASATIHTGGNVSMLAYIEAERKLCAALMDAWPAIRERLKAAERRAKAFEAIRELFDRFDTRFASCRDQVILTDDLIERCRDAIRCANGGETGAEFQS